jgi:cardiolipin synthase
MRKFSFCLFSKLPAHEFRITFSTVITIIRIIAVPFIVSAMLWGKWGTAALLFFIASLTDMLDGSIARYFNQKTFLGACLDPLADKLLLVSCFATLAWTNILPFQVPYWFVGLVLLRELMIVLGVLYVYCNKSGVEIDPTPLGKATTALQMLFIMWLFLCYFYQWIPAKTYYGSLYIITILVIVSFIQYAKIGFCYYRNGGKC